MKHIATQVVFALMLVTITARRFRRQNDNPDFTPQTQNRTCKTRNGVEGICVHESLCNEDHTIEPGGIIDDSEIRAGNCPNLFDWCCTLVDEKVIQESRLKDCVPAQSNNCPWCVALYRSGGHPRTKTRTGLFCSGAIISKNVILTTASCMLSAQKQDVWAHIPGSLMPLRNYTVQNMIKHPNYNSGTREHDLAVMYLSESVQWEMGSTESRGGCLGFRDSLIGECFAVGFDASEKMIMTKLMVSSGSCSEGGAVYDAACGRADDKCIVETGSPILCRSDGGGFLAAGIARNKCTKNTALLGSLQHSAQWLNHDLKIFAIPESQ